MSTNMSNNQLLLGVPDPSEIQILSAQTSGAREDKSSRTCTACKDRKRKCDRQVPACSFCQRKNVACDYPKLTKAGAHTAHSKNVGTGSLLPRAHDHGSQFPAAFFLDSRLFRQSQMQLPLPIWPVPSSILSLTGTLNEIKLVASEYFDTIHIWLPFISKIRLQQSILSQASPLSQPRGDVALLLLCMKLIIWNPSEKATFENPQHTDYLAAKQFLLEIETAGVLTVQVAQACILLTLYELGHAIYPAAYISIGTCARYVMALGFNGKMTAHTTEVSEWIKQEERRRVWWAVVILDRFSNLGSPERPLSTADLRSDDLLPVDDTAWDQGVITYNDELTIFSPPSIQMGMFARICQATNLLAQVLRHVSESTSNDAYDSPEAIQIDRTIRSLMNLTRFEVESKVTAVCLQTSVCCSALLVLNNVRSLSVRKTLADEMVVLSRIFLSKITQTKTAGDGVSPLLIYWAYQAASTYASLYLESGDGSHLESWAIVDNCLKVLAKRWGVAGAYLQLLDMKMAREIS